MVAPAATSRGCRRRRETELGQRHDPLVVAAIRRHARRALGWRPRRWPARWPSPATLGVQERFRALRNGSSPASCAVSRSRCPVRPARVMIRLSVFVRAMWPAASGWAHSRPARTRRLRRRRRRVMVPVPPSLAPHKREPIPPEDRPQARAATAAHPSQGRRSLSGNRLASAAPVATPVPRTAAAIHAAALPTPHGPRVTPPRRRRGARVKALPTPRAAPADRMMTVQRGNPRGPSPRFTRRQLHRDVVLVALMALLRHGRGRSGGRGRGLGAGRGMRSSGQAEPDSPGGEGAFHGKDD